MNRRPRKSHRPGSGPASPRRTRRTRGTRGKQQKRQSGDAPAGERLQKVLAAAGVGSRRQCEEFIRDGRVDVDGKTVTELGTRVDPFQQEIRVDGVKLARSQPAYFAVNKPVGVVTTNRDPARRTRVVDLVRTNQRLFPVGRLDRSSEGLILLTNDGDFANRLAHPRYEVEKTYRVIVAGHPAPESLQKLLKGVHLAEGVARVDSIRLRSRRQQSTELEIVLTEGRNREIRRLLARIGHKVLRLKRVAIGPLRLGDLPVGACRKLTHGEVEALRKASAARQRAPRSAKPSAPPQSFPDVEVSVHEDYSGDGVEQHDFAADDDWVEIPWEPSSQGIVLGDDEPGPSDKPQRRFADKQRKGKGRGKPQRGRSAPFRRRRKKD